MTVVNRQLREMTQADLAMVRAWRNHPDVRGYMYTRHEITTDEHSAWFAAASKDKAQHLLIFERDAISAGFVSFREKGGGIADWGFYLAPDAERGTGRALGAAALDYGFGSAGFHKICGQVIAFNERSIAYHRKLRFRQEGVLRQEHFDGEDYHDVVCFGILSEEWSHEG